MKSCQLGHLRRCRSTRFKLFKAPARSFSAYANYDHNSQFYDNCRTPVGTNVVQACINSAYWRKQHELWRELQSDGLAMQILDAGCGTGNYIDSLVSQNHIPNELTRFYGIDLNQSMLDCAQHKLSTYDNVELLHGSMLNLTDIFPHNFFDCVMINQALHHLDTIETRKENFLNLRTALNEIHQVLKPGGSLCINLSFPTQLKDGIWFYQMLPTASHEMSLKFPDSEWFCDQFQKISFRPTLELNTAQNDGNQENFNDDSDIAKQQMDPCQTRSHGKYFETAIYEPFIKPHIYFDFEGPFKQEWRSCDSIWNLATIEEIEQCHTRLKRILADDVEYYQLRMNAHQALESLGHSTTVVAYK